MYTQAKYFFILALAASLAMGCSTANKKTESATNDAVSDASSESTLLLTLPQLYYRYHFGQFNLVVPVDESYIDAALVYKAKAVYETISPKMSPKPSELIYEGTTIQNDHQLFIFSATSNQTWTRYGITNARRSDGNSDTQEPAKVFRLDDEDEVYLSDAAIEWSDEENEMASRLINRSKTNEDILEMEFISPGNSWGENSMEIVDDNFNLNEITSYIHTVLVPKFHTSNPLIPKAENYFIQLDGKSQIDQKDALEFSVGIKANDSRFYLFRTAVDSEQNVYLYEAQPVQIATMPENLTAPVCEDVTRPKYSNVPEPSVYQYPDYQLRVHSTTFKKGVIPVTIAAYAAIEAARNLDGALQPTQMQSLDTGFLEYTLVAGSSVPKKFDIQLDSVVQIHGVDAYDFSIGTVIDPGWSRQKFVPHTKIAVAQDRKIYSYTYKTILAGTLSDNTNASSALEYLFSVEYNSGQNCQQFSGNSNYSYSLMLTRYLEESIPSENAFDDFDCSLFESAASFVSKQYISGITASVPKQWVILFDELTDRDGEVAYHIYVGHDQDGSKMKVSAHFIVTQSGNVYQYDTLIGNINQ
ncbi:MAG: hypothetical protein J6A01_01885 [Proteobacteria bacterium]|nr:hypothetical protein [Pseudomonadota bacterium]